MQYLKMGRYRDRTISYGRDSKMMLEASNENNTNIDNLLKFLDQNPGVDFNVFNLRDEENINRLNFKNLVKKKPEIILQVKAFQRLIRIITEKNQEAALALMQHGVNSALQIAAMTRKDFMVICADLFDEKLADEIYKNAQEKRSTILIQYMNVLQNGEPHMSSARFY